MEQLGSMAGMERLVGKRSLGRAFPSQAWPHPLSRGVPQMLRASTPHNPPPFPSPQLHTHLIKRQNIRLCQRSHGSRFFLRPVKPARTGNSALGIARFSASAEWGLPVHPPSVFGRSPADLVAARGSPQPHPSPRTHRYVASSISDQSRLTSSRSRLGASSLALASSSACAAISSSGMPRRLAPSCSGRSRGGRE